MDRLLVAEDLARAAILIYANKQDLKDAMDADELTQSLGLQSVRTHPYHVQACCALTGEGLYDGLNWLVAVRAPRVAAASLLTLPLHSN